MSPQVEFLKNLIESAQTGNEGAVAMLRRICCSAASQAPNPDLIAIAQCLYHLGIEATQSKNSRN
jgi:Holliday junction resolvase